MNAAAVEVKPSARLQTHTMNTTICLIYILACSWFLPSSWSASMFGGGIFMIFFKTKADDFWGPMATVTDACPGMISSILPWKIYKCMKLRQCRLYPLNLLFLFEKTQPKQHRSDPLQRTGQSNHIFMRNAPLEALIGCLANGKMNI